MQEKGKAKGKQPSTRTPRVCTYPDHLVFSPECRSIRLTFPALVQVHWTNEIDRKLLLIQLTDPQMCMGYENLKTVAEMFRGRPSSTLSLVGTVSLTAVTEKPTPKALQVRLSQLRKLGKVIMDEPIEESTQSCKRNPVLDIDLDDQVFREFPVTWADLPADLFKKVKAECEKRAQEKEWEETMPQFIEMHKRKYAEEEAAVAQREDAARTLIEMSASLTGK